MTTNLTTDDEKVFPLLHPELIDVCPRCGYEGDDVRVNHYEEVEFCPCCRAEAPDGDRYSSNLYGRIDGPHDW